jgi:hypothetical protein
MNEDIFDRLTAHRQRPVTPRPAHLRLSLQQLRADLDRMPASEIDRLAGIAEDAKRAEEARCAEEKAHEAHMLRRWIDESNLTEETAREWARNQTTKNASTCSITTLSGDDETTRSEDERTLSDDPEVQSSTFELVTVPVFESGLARSANTDDTKSTGWAFVATWFLRLCMPLAGAGFATLAIGGSIITGVIGKPALMAAIVVPALLQLTILVFGFRSWWRSSLGERPLNQLVRARHSVNLSDQLRDPVRPMRRRPR